MTTKKYYLAHRDEILAKSKLYTEEHKDELRKKWKEYRKKNKDKIYETENTPYNIAKRRLKTYNRMDLANFGCLGNLTAEWIRDNILSKPCVHCGESDYHKIGCNRIDNSKPHTMDNVEPCCYICNTKLYYKTKMKTVYQYDIEDNLINVWKSANEAARELCIHQQHITNCCNKKPHNKTYKGYKWSYEPL